MAETRSEDESRLARVKSSSVKVSSGQVGKVKAIGERSLGVVGMGKVRGQSWRCVYPALLYIWHGHQQTWSEGFLWKP